MSTATAPITRDDPVNPMVASATFLAMSRALTELLAAIAEQPRSAMKFLASADIDTDTFSQFEDLRVIFDAIKWAGDLTPGTPPRSKIEICARIMAGLKRLNFWNGDDVRTFVSGGMCWGPGAVATLLCAVKHDPEIIHQKIEQVLSIAGQLDALEGVAL